MKIIRTVISILIVVTFLAVIFPVGANAAPMMGTKDDLKAFHGKWTSERLGSPQTLKIRCDVETGYCKMDMVTEVSTSCTILAGVPTGRYFEGEGMVEVIDQRIEIPAISYCMTKPPSDFHYDDPPLPFTYHPADDTLTDIWGVTWYRK